jgi:hypothetical protein
MALAHRIHTQYDATAGRRLNLIKAARGLVASNACGFG